MNERHIVKVDYLLKCRNCGTTDRTPSQYLAVISSDGTSPVNFNVHFPLLNFNSSTVLHECTSENGSQQIHSEMQAIGITFNPDELVFDSETEKTLLEIRDYIERSIRGHKFEIFYKNDALFFRTLNFPDLEEYRNFTGALAAWDLNMVKYNHSIASNWDRTHRDRLHRMTSKFILSRYSDNEVVLVSEMNRIRNLFSKTTLDSFTAVILADGRVIIGYKDKSGTNVAEDKGHYSLLPLLPEKADPQTDKCLRRWLARNTH